MTNTKMQQAAFSAESSHDWRVVVSNKWDVLGPFPIHAREQHFLSPSYPINLSERTDYNARWSSSYADGGEVGWTKALSANGSLAVSFPNIRWSSLRATEGWAALQHHNVLRTTITVYPPSTRVSSTEPPRLLIDIKQGSFFSVLPSWEDNAALRALTIPKWHAGNIYSMNAAPPEAISLPSPPSLDGPTAYDLFISGDYEIRLFGDPAVLQSEVPELLIDFAVKAQRVENKLEVVTSHNVVPDFVNGWAFGQAMGIGLRSVGDWWTVKEVKLAHRQNHYESQVNPLQVKLLEETRIAPTQTRIIPVSLKQTHAFLDTHVSLEISVISADKSAVLSVTLPVKHLSHWNEDDFKPIIITYFYGILTPTALIAIPPKHPNAGVSLPPLLVLHGAGVDVLKTPFWGCSPPRQERSWLIIPTGRTAWGLDWHGPSAQDAWASVEALSAVLKQLDWQAWYFPPDTRVVLVGHSNGGQGTWYVAARYPDRVLAAIPAAGYVKAQAYVSLVQSRSAHFIDPALRAILESSLTSDDNDLFLSNLVDTPILAVHGGSDENVPVWHTRALVDTLKTWRQDANVTFREDPDQPHCYPAILDNDNVQAFIDRTISQAEKATVGHTPWHFTLTVAIPSESDSLHGWRIQSLLTPGRLARLTVVEEHGAVTVASRNVKTFSIAHNALKLAAQAEGISLVIDNQNIRIDNDRLRGISGVLFVLRDETWQLQEGNPSQPENSQASGRMSLILNGPGPLTVVIPSKTDHVCLDAALRLAHSLDVFHKLDSVIVDAQEAIELVRQRVLSSNIVTIGVPNNDFLTPYLTSDSRTAFQLRAGSLYLKGRPLDPKSAAVFLQPHPLSPARLMLSIFSYDAAGLERALRLFPIRTGITVPDWIVLSPNTDFTGAAGTVAAGVWGVNWSWNEGMSSV